MVVSEGQGQLSIVPQAAVQTRKICVTFVSKLALGYHQRPSCIRLWTRHGPHKRIGPDVPMASDGKAGHSDQGLAPDIHMVSDGSPNYKYLLGLCQ